MPGLPVPILSGVSEAMFGSAFADAAGAARTGDDEAAAKAGELAAGHKTAGQDGDTRTGDDKAAVSATEAKGLVSGGSNP